MLIFLWRLFWISVIQVLINKCMISETIAYEHEKNVSIRVTKPRYFRSGKNRILWNFNLNFIGRRLSFVLWNGNGSFVQARQVQNKKSVLEYVGTKTPTSGVVNTWFAASVALNMCGLQIYVSFFCLPTPWPWVMLIWKQMGIEIRYFNQHF